MMFEEDFAQFCIEDSAIGGEIDGRVYGLIRPQGGRLPDILYYRTSIRRDATYCGTDPLVLGTYQVECNAKKYIQAKQLARLVKQTFVDFNGMMGTTKVKDMKIESEVDTDDAEPGIYKTILIFTVWFVENV